MNDFEKRCYNNYLLALRSGSNKPFRARKNFEGFELTPEYGKLKKICNFFYKFPNVIPSWYFKAPYEVYPDQKYFSLDFYATQKAIKTYTTYMKLQRNKDPDNSDIINFIKESLKFIAHYCIDNNIPLKKYITHKEGATYAWMQHLKEYKICIYPILEYPSIYGLVQQLPEDEKQLFLGEMADNLLVYRQRLAKTKHAKIITKEGMDRIERVVKKYLKKSLDKR